MTYAEFTDHTQPGYLAPNFNALLVLLEHRYYGASEVQEFVLFLRVLVKIL